MSFTLKSSRGTGYRIQRKGRFKSFHSDPVGIQKKGRMDLGDRTSRVLACVCALALLTILAKKENLEDRSPKYFSECNAKQNIA